MSAVSVNWTVCCMWQLKSYSHCHLPPPTNVSPSHTFLHPQGFILLRTLLEKFLNTHVYNFIPITSVAVKSLPVNTIWNFYFLVPRANKWNLRFSQQWILQTYGMWQCAVWWMATAVSGQTASSTMQKTISARVPLGTSLPDYMVSYSRTALP
jgi:hypothetical protein